MSVLTKVFVVLATILAVLLVPLMIAYVNNTDHFKTDYETEKAMKGVAETRAQIVEASLARAQEAQATALAKVNAEKAGLDAQIQNITGKFTAEQVAKINAQNELATKNAQISQLTAGQEQAGKIIADQAKQLDELQNKFMTTEKRFVEVSNVLEEKTTTLATLTEQVRLIQEQLKDAQDELAQRQTQQIAAPGTGTPGTGSAVQAAPLPPVTIRGQITAVEAVGDQTFVAINVGRQDNVAEGMHFIIHHGDQYLGSVTITKVDLNSAAGRVTLKRGDIAKNLDVMATAF
ncbi:MAG: hypothetical protein WC058_05595 [Phycisphaeraceae bacterium]